MSNSKKSWDASKASKRSTDANKQNLKINAGEAKAAQKRIAKGKI